MSRHLPWFRLYAEMVDDEKIRLLAFEDRWHYVALLCCKCQGLLDAGDSRELLERKLAVKLGLQLRELETVAGRLAEVGLIDPDTFQPLGWEGRQMRSDSSRERVAAFRERKKQARNVTVTAQDTDTDTETDISPSTDGESRREKRARGTRLPEDWQPTPELLAYANSRGWHGQALADEIENFRDYWTAKTGASATKLDWPATFRTWIRKARPPHDRTHLDRTHLGGDGRRLSAVERVKRANARAGFPDA
jgi:hypothetical protein